MSRLKNALFVGACWESKACSGAEILDRKVKVVDYW